ncbi:MAG: polynucleotide adenylyltransferase PcnB [Planctomycetota bacterium]|nr:MAG: polynucleotide adenylyltransferase PcnB [Planctomycetota bacterium]
MQPNIIARPQHPISRSLIDRDVVNILYRLKHAGYQAYIVGGAVRDILRGEQPKDFDIATDARPMELRRMFRNSRIIGRRFRLVHIFFGHKNIEVATLRETVQPDVDEELLQTEAHLRLDDERMWGTVESDALRRDFTCNALYYSIDDFSILDYVGGVEDVHANILRSIGDPAIRFCEDPVRMLRAVKFAARFGFRIAEQTAVAMLQCAGEITKASRFRVTEEVFRILMQKNRHQGLAMLRDYNLLDHLFPTWLEAIGAEGLDQVIEFFDTVEHHSGQGNFLPLEVLTAGLFLPMLDEVEVESRNYTDHAAAMTQEVRDIARDMDLPKRLVSSVIILLRGQLYMLYLANRPRQISKFVANREFDWIWRLHDLAFGHLPQLHIIQERWLSERERLPTPLGGWVDHPDQRDIFSFRGITGGGRRRADEPASIIVDSDTGAGRSRRRRRRRR